MKPSLESVRASGTHSFLVRQFDEKGFRAPYHFHPQLELTFILSGKGKRYVGNNMSEFEKGDFVLLGPNLPHCWKAETQRKGEKPSSIVIQFTADFLGDSFFEKPELKSIQQLFRRSENGIQFKGNAQPFQNRMLDLLNEANNYKKLILLLELLHQLSLSKKYLSLRQKFSDALMPAEQPRLHTAMTYIVDEYKNSISLTKAASLANMTPSAFCKYFKKCTRKTFMEVVTDYRIDYAAQQLVHSDNTISHIGFTSGFNDLSQFHKTFKAKMQMSPLQYRNTFMEKMQ